MAEPTHIGKVFVWGLDGTLAYSGLLTTENEPSDLTYKDEISRHESKDRKGETCGIQLYDPHPQITIKFMPCSASTGSGQIANARTKVVLPTKGSKVTVAAFPPNTGTAEDVTINSAKWIYLGGGEISLNNEKEVEITLPLEKWSTDFAVNNT